MATEDLDRALAEDSAFVHGGVYANNAKALASGGKMWAVTPKGEVWVWDGDDRGTPTPERLSG
jgi:hypothetical protein